MIFDHLRWWPVGADQRRYLRRRVEDEISVDLVYSDDKGMHSNLARLVDVSEAGAQLISNHGRVTKGMTLVIKTNNKGLISTMSQEAQVMWALKEGAAMRFGVKYTQLVETPKF
jgi:hypothetical protein